MEASITILTNKITLGKFCKMPNEYGLQAQLHNLTALFVIACHIFFINITRVQ